MLVPNPAAGMHGRFRMSCLMFPFSVSHWPLRAAVGLRKAASEVQGAQAVRRAARGAAAAAAAAAIGGVGGRALGRLPQTAGD